MKKNKNINFINWVGVYTLFAKETKRFCKVYQQTILAPAFTSLLFFLVISIEFRGGIKRSTIFPCILEPNIEEDVFANAFCIIVITIKPGAKKFI